MKLRLLGAGVLLAASVLAPQQAHALVVTTAYVPFKLFQNPAFNTGFPLSFANFNTTFGLGAEDQTLTGVRFNIAGAADGTGSAMVGGNPVVANTSFSNNTQAFISYLPQFTLTPSFGGPAIVSTGAAGTPTPNPVSCINNPTAGACPAAGGNVVPAFSNRVLDLQGNYNDTSVFSAIPNISGWRSGTVSSNSGTAGFMGTGTDMAYTFDPTVVGPIVAKPFIMGFVAVEYQYSAPLVVPGPLPLFGAAAAFGWSRRLKKRISSAA